MSRAAFERVVSQLDPHATLVRHWELKGGISADITALEIRRADGTTTKLIVRRHGELDRMRNPNITADEFRLLQFLLPHDVAAPTPIHIDTTCTIFPTPYLVVGFVDGAIDLRDEPADAHLDAMARQLTRIHDIDGGTEAIAFLPPAAKTIQWLLDHRPAMLDSSMAEAVSARTLESVWPWPQQQLQSKLLHGDYWPGNILLARRCVGRPYSTGKMPSAAIHCAISGLRVSICYGRTANARWMCLRSAINRSRSSI